MNLGTITKSPSDVLDYDADFVRWLIDGDTVTSAVASITGSSVVVDAVDVSDDRVKIWLSGGASGDAGTLTLIATTMQGRTKEVCFRLRVKGC